MPYNPKIHHRRSIRLQNYDYSQPGTYFLTICVQDRACLFGNVVDGEMRLNDAGIMIESVWDNIPTNYPGVGIDASVIMPNHFHGIVVIVGAGPRACPNPDRVKDAEWMQEAGRLRGGEEGRPRGAEEGRPRGAEEGRPRGAAPTGLSLADVAHRFKTMTTKRYVDGVRHHQWQPFAGRLWQRNYWEHIVRDETELNRIREYIVTNPVRWEMDRLHPDHGVGTVREEPAMYGPDGVWRVDDADWMV